MTDLERIENYITKEFDKTNGIIERIGKNTDKNVTNIAELTIIVEFLKDELDEQKKENSKHIQNLYDRVSNRVKISTVFWIVGIAVTIMGIASTAVANYLKG